jgi:hypothetical protein
MADFSEEYAIKTWRYLRMGMVGLVVGLAASILYEFVKTDPACLQTSISAYYYTPVRAFFVAALVGIGVSLFCLKGSTPREDILLNLAGMFAPFVAFVPTGDPNRCTSVRGSSLGFAQNIDNNVTALLVVGLLAALVLLVRRGKRLLEPPNAAGYLTAALVWVALTVWFFLPGDSFTDHAHTVTAVAMFVCIFIVVWDNAIHYEPPGGGRRNPYRLIAVLMLASAVATGLAALLFGKGYSVLVIEAIFIVLFTLFWLIQTGELGDKGLRVSGAGS